MNVILVYDVNVKRVAKVLKTCRKYLYWVQNSVFEGEISPAKLEKLKMELSKIIEPEEDSVIIYTFRSSWYTNREIIGLKKGGDEVFL
ncbi:MAG: CRISPR-associated endonuclease Cas2 [candidate division WOR-3 bacterium]|jgi:CRISPR-associated protein Cas2